MSGVIVDLALHCPSQHLALQCDGGIAIAGLHPNGLVSVWITEIADTYRMYHSAFNHNGSRVSAYWCDVRDLPDGCPGTLLSCTCTGSCTATPAEWLHRRLHRCPRRSEDTSPISVRPLAQGGVPRRA